MANAMKKLKLLHHLTAASASHPPPHPVATPPPPHASQQFPTPPASPVSPQTSPIRHLYHPTQAHAHYTDVLRSARAALHTLHTNQPSFTNTAHPPPPPPPQAPANMPGATQCLLPGGFMVLTPANSYDNTPGLCVPASPPPPNMSINRPTEILNGVPRGNQTIYSSRPPPSGSPKSGSYHRSRSPPKPRQRLTKEAVAKVGKDSRLVRWERVLGYVRAQRNATLGAQLDGISGTSPSKLDRKRRAEEIATIEARNAMLDSIDIEEQDVRSLWSGGSGGTNGVDEFVWSEDEDDDILPMPTGPPPKKVFPEELTPAEECEGIFEMQVDDDVLMGPPNRTSTPPSMKRPRPRSTPEELAFQKTPWGKRIVEEMPALCREADLEGGLNRLVGRRMSAAY